MHEITIERIEMRRPKVPNIKLSVPEKKCNSCIKQDVCRLKEEFEEIVEDLMYGCKDPESFEVEIKCKRWAPRM